MLFIIIMSELVVQVHDDCGGVVRKHKMLELEWLLPYVRIGYSARLTKR